MKKYEVIVVQTMYGTAVVEANSKEEAYEYACNNGPDLCDADTTEWYDCDVDVDLVTEVKDVYSD